MASLRELEGQTIDIVDVFRRPNDVLPHAMEAIEPLTYLMGGEMNADDIVIYPDAGVRRVHGELEALPTGGV